MAWTDAGYWFANPPVRKNVAVTPSRSNVDKIEGSPEAFAPASNVNAMTRAVVGSTSRSLPRRVAGKVGGPDGVVAVGADVRVGVSAADVGCLVGDGDVTGVVGGARVVVTDGEGDGSAEGLRPHDAAEAPTTRESTRAVNA
jgi:hypothetical protein